MNADEKQAVIRCLEQVRGDDLYRAERAFANQPLDVLHGESGMTRREILERYRKHEDRINALIAAVNNAK